MAMKAAAALVVIAVGAVFLTRAVATRSASVPMLPNPAVDVSVATAPKSDTAVLAGGCFWGVSEVFKHVKGVSAVVSGYAGGQLNAPTYGIVSSGMTGHAESVQIAYDPSTVSYGTLLKVFFAVAHDPTTLNKQGPDHGTQYRSAIFFRSPDQQKVAESYVAQLTASHAFKEPIVTQVAPLPFFSAAEDYHQDYFTKNRYTPYIVINDAPKVKHLEKDMPELWQAK
jgi:peptide-methionine (S)-S-oxide reductase